MRTDPAAKKQEGISFLLIDMKTPGITVRPIQTIDGGHEVNEVFFDDVKVPAENLVGEENKGWNYAKFLLGNERTGIARIGISKSRIRRLKELAAIEQADGEAADRRRTLPRQDRRGRDRTQSAGDDATARGRRRAHARRKRQARPGLFDSQDQGLGDPAGHHRTAARSRRALRAARSDSARRRASAGTSRRSAPIGPARSAPQYFNYRKMSIYGGSNEIQKQIIAKAILGF